MDEMKQGRSQTSFHVGQEVYLLLCPPFFNIYSKTLVYMAKHLLLGETNSLLIKSDIHKGWGEKYDV